MSQREDVQVTGNVVIELDGVNKMVHGGSAGDRMNQARASE